MAATMTATTMVQPAADALAAGVELPADLVALVLLPLRGDVRSLCAAACVARAWRDAATKTRLWTQIGPLHPRTAARLTDARLDSLVSRARGGLRHLNLTGVGKSSVTDAGLAVALRRESRIAYFGASGDRLTGASIAVALERSRGHLRRLRVCGQRAASAPAASRASCNAALGALRALLAPGGSMDAESLCAMREFLGFSGRVCKRMCTLEGACDGCGATCCQFHTTCVTSCSDCGDPVCTRCSSYVTGVCDDCVLNAEDEEEEVPPRCGCLFSLGGAVLRCFRPVKRLLCWRRRHRSWLRGRKLKLSKRRAEQCAVYTQPNAPDAPGEDETAWRRLYV